MPSTYSTSPTAPLRAKAALFFVLHWALVFGDVVSAAAPVFVPVEFHTRKWTTDDGLPHNSVSAVLQDSTGFLWFATVGGLARFDGIQFVEMRAPAEYRNYGFNIRSIAEARPGVLLVLPAGDTVLQLSAGLWNVHPVNTALAQLRDPPAALNVSAGGEIWITTLAGRVIRWSADGKTRIYDREAGLGKSSREVSIVAHPAGGMWICGDSLWFANAEGDLTEIRDIPDEPGLIGPGQNGLTWLLNGNRLVQLGAGVIANEFVFPDNFRPTAVRHLYEDVKGGVWIASSRQGLYRFAEGRLTRLGDFSTAAFVCQDRERNIWVATDGNGVGQLREKTSRLLSTKEGLAQSIVSSLSEDPSGRVWLANRSGGLYWVGNDGRLQSAGLTGSKRFANVVQAATDGAIWFGGGRNGLFRWNPDGEQPQQQPEPPSDLHAVYQAKNGALWFAADGGRVGNYLDGKLQLIEHTGVLDELRAIAEDRHGHIWLSGRQGVLVRWDGKEIDIFDTARGFPRVLVHSLHFDENDRLWAGTSGGLILKRGDIFKTLGEANGLSDDIIEDVITDQLGNLWMASRRGIFHSAISDLVRAADDPSYLVSSQRLGPDEGLVGLTPTPNYRPTSLRSRNGLLWFATAQGALIVDPSRIARDLPAPPVLVDSVSINGKVFNAADELRIKSGKQRFEFRFAALTFTSPEAVSLRHRLEGVDADWVFTSGDRTASYTNLPPGEYRLEVTAKGSSGDWTPKGAEFHFSVIPAWWETLGFRVIFFVVLLVLVAAVVRVIAQRRLKHRLHVLEQQHALEKERGRIARDLHDELGAGLTEVGLLADRLVDTAPAHLGPQLSGLAWRTRRLATDLSGIVWTMNSRDASLDKFASFLGRYAGRLFRNTETKCKVLGADTIPALPLPPDLQHHLLAATKEALNNVLIHARATEAILEMSFADGFFRIQVADNGRGTEKPDLETSEGNGLRNMRARTEEMGGTFVIRSGIGQGTTVVLCIPFNSPKKT